MKFLAGSTTNVAIPVKINLYTIAKCTAGMFTAMTGLA